MNLYLPDLSPGGRNPQPELYDGIELNSYYFSNERLHAL
jgi:hypothetical protein